jgi:hypothetical protein
VEPPLVLPPVAAEPPLALPPVAVVPPLAAVAPPLVLPPMAEGPPLLLLPHPAMIAQRPTMTNPSAFRMEFPCHQIVFQTVN